MAVREPPDELLTAMSSGPRPIVVVGAGVTRSQVGSWSDLLHNAIQFAEDRDLDAARAAELRARVNSSRSAEDLIAVATEVEGMLKDRGRFGAWLQTEFSHLVEPGPLVKAVLRVGKRFDAALATTNYDTLLHPGGATVTWRQPDRLLAVLRGDRPEPGYPSTVAHLHGYWDEPESVVFGGTDYKRHAAGRHVATLNAVIGLGHTLVFIGCGDGLTDPNWARLLLRMQKFKARHSHFRLCRERDSGEVPAVVANVVYGDDHDDLIPFLDALAQRGPVRSEPVREPRLLAECGENVAVVAITPDAGTLATANADRFLQLWSLRRADDAEAFGELQKLPLANYATCAVFHPGGTSLAIGTPTDVRFYSRSEAVWKLVTNSIHAGGPGALTFLANGEWLALHAASLLSYPAVCCGTPEQLMFSLENFTPPHLTFLNVPVDAVAFADERWFASAGADGVTRVWCLPDADPLGCMSEPKAKGPSYRLLQLWASDPRGDEPRLAIASGAERLAVGDRDGWIHVHDTRWLTASGPELRSAAIPAQFGSRTGVHVGDWCDLEHGATVTALGMSADGATLVAASADGVVGVWDIATRNKASKVCSLDGRGVVRSMALAPDGHTLATASGDGPARIWDLRP
jgi:SIR2-like protein/WD40 domain-containing protein